MKEGQVLINFVVYYEPAGDDNSHTIVYLTPIEAVCRQRKSSIQARGVDLYLTNQEALKDFIAVNWAHREEKWV